MSMCGKANLLHMSDLVTGDAVVLELRLAKLASRSLALALDLALQVTAAVVGAFVLGGLLDFVDDALATAIALVFYVAVVVGYPVVFETATRGRSPGKMAMGLRVVREDGGPIRFRHAFVRGLMGVVEIWLTVGSVALITSLASSKGKRLGDYLAGTVVVRERVPAHGAPVIAMPPPLAAWAAQLDLSRVPDDLALAARQFLSRVNELAPSAREEMGSRLVASLAAVTAPSPPPGTPHWAFLAAVLAERRRRELTRLTGGMPASSSPQRPPYQPTMPAPPPTPWPPAPPPPPPASWPPAATPAKDRPDGFAPPG
jgi:uncharacterized RDD family membrane protein YckC